jgi:hypothetical protein
MWLMVMRKATSKSDVTKLWQWELLVRFHSTDAFWHSFALVLLTDKAIVSGSTVYSCFAAAAALLISFSYIMLHCIEFERGRLGNPQQVFQSRSAARMSITVAVWHIIFGEADPPSIQTKRRHMQLSPSLLKHIQHQIQAYFTVRHSVWKMFDANFWGFICATGFEARGGRPPGSGE